MSAAPGPLAAGGITLDGERAYWSDGRLTPVGRVHAELPAIPAALCAYGESRNNRLLLAASAQSSPPSTGSGCRLGADRIAILLGTSTSGIAEAEVAVAAMHSGQPLPAGFDHRQRELGSPGSSGPVIWASHRPPTLSTACSSSARAFISARRLLMSGLADHGHRRGRTACAG